MSKIDDELRAKEKILTELEGFYSALRNDRDSLRTRVERYEAALKKYADVMNWEDTHCESGCTSFPGMWDVAQAALAPPVGEKEK